MGIPGTESDVFEVEEDRHGGVGIVSAHERRVRRA
jgi:hypothetical protein